MKNILILLLVALLAIAVLLFLFNPELLEKIWLWIVGLIGVIVSAIQRFIEWIKSLFNKSEKEKSQSQVAVGSENQEKLRSAQKKITELETTIQDLEAQLKMEEPGGSFDGITLTVLRYMHDQETTLGLLFVGHEFFSYTLEDTYRKTKIAGKTRIPKGTYRLAFREVETDLTLKYRKTRPWFKYHLHVKDVPGFSGIYIHSGSTHEHTAGCLLVATSIQSNSTRKMIHDSRVTFERLYKMLRPKIETGVNVRIRYYDEDFLSHPTINYLAS